MHRKYGYINKSRETRKQSTSERTEPVFQEKRIKVQKPSKFLSYFSKILSFLLVLPFKILRWFFLGLVGLWRKKPKLSNKTGKVVRKRIFSIVLTLGILIIVGGTLYTVWLGKNLPDPDRLTDRQIAQSTKIYDRTGEHLLYEIFSDQKRTLVELENIPEQLINAVIATEDTEFYNHIGIRPFSIFRSIVYGLVGKGRIGSGASTLTQQLVKNAILSNERTISRKIKEILLSLQLEQRYSKQQILKIYFNEIPYGSTNYGVEAAAQSYFAKSVTDLDLEQIATLAGLPKAPSRYLRNNKRLKDRRDFVLERMVAEGYITREEADTAQATEPSLNQKITNIRAPHFVFYVREQLIEKYGEQMVDTGGLRVITTLDWDKQQIAEAAILEQSEDRFQEAEVNNAALVAIDPKNGQVLAHVGSLDFFNDEINGKFDVATQGLRQPGSSFKPIVYTAAFEKGFTPQTVLFDVETNFAVAGDDYEPKNYDLEEHGLVTMRKALQGSMNIPAVKTLYLVGSQKGVDFAERLGYSTLSQGDFGLSLVLGGGEVYLLEHVAAYGVFAANGVRHTPVSLLKVEDSKGDVLFEWKKQKGERVLDEKITATISNVLSDDSSRAFAFGAGGVLTLPDRPVAAKTGTTNSYVDAWTVGYTPSLVAGVWAGNTDNTPMKRGFGGSKVAAPIWNKFMRDALANTPTENFPNPPVAQITKPSLRGSNGGGILLLVDKVTGKLATSSTPENYIVERTYIPPHSLLHYVNKDDPQGPEPDDPSVDPQYQVWEDAIADWINRNKEKNPDWDVEFGDPPTEFDDVHSLELIPTLNVIFPSASSTLFSRQIDTDIRVSAPRGVTKVTYKINNRFVGTIREHPFNLNYYAADVEDGVHELIITVEDDIGNRLIREIPFTMKAGVEPPRVTWSEKSVRVRQELFPRVFFLNPFKLDEIKEVIIYKKQSGDSRTLLQTINNFTNLFNNQISFKWNTPPDTGSYELIAEAVSETGTRTSSKVVVEVLQ
jgi:1A family penicillin-binding protein